MALMEDLIVFLLQRRERLQQDMLPRGSVASKFSARLNQASCIMEANMFLRTWRPCGLYGSGPWAHLGDCCSCHPHGLKTLGPGES